VGESRAIRKLAGQKVLLWEAIQLDTMPATLSGDCGTTLFGLHLERERCHHSSPGHNVTNGAPPGIPSYGMADTPAPFATAGAFCARLRALGRRCGVDLYERHKHGSVNTGRGCGKFFCSWHRRG